MQKIIVAIDGYAACGKSTLAKQLAKALDYIYIDTGAMYRATTLYFQNNKINITDEQAVEQALQKIEIRFQFIGNAKHTFLNGVDVEEPIRTMQVSSFVSEVAAISAVRRAMVLQQQEMGKAKGFVVDGRDIGTVVFKDAELKLFLNASLDERITRRLLELQQKGKLVSREQVKDNLIHRDYIDTNRADSPLMKAEDALEIDNTSLNPQEQLEKVKNLALESIKHACVCYE